LIISYLSNNNFIGPIPTTIGFLSNLRKLDFFGNTFNSTLPSEMGRLTMLDSLNMRGCEIRGTIPPSFADLTLLTFLDLGVNRLSGPYGFLGNLTSLGKMKLDKNSFRDIPIELARLQKNTIIQLSYNKINQELPEPLLDFPNL
jgi:Leucine-rich repeat (LRR) protein